MISSGPMFWLTVSTLIFSIGLYGVLTRRNAIGILISIELLLNSAALNFVIFNRFMQPASVDGQLAAMFIIATAAAEVVVAMAVFVAIFQHRKTVDVTQMDQLHD